MHVIRGFFHMVLMSFGEEEKKTFDLGTFLLGKVYHLAVYATALTHSLHPMCWDISCSWSGSGTDAAWSRAVGTSSYSRGWHGWEAKMHCRGCKVNLKATHAHKSQGRPGSHLGRTSSLQWCITTSLSGGGILKHHPHFLNIFTGDISSDEFRALRLET